MRLPIDQPANAPAVLELPEDVAGSSHQRMVGPPDARWMTYLLETGEIDGYEGLCKCYSCQRVREGYERWKYEKLHNPRPTWRPNAELSESAQAKQKP